MHFVINEYIRLTEHRRRQFRVCETYMASAESEPIIGSGDGAKWQSTWSGEYGQSPVKLRTF